ncbi:hypothetical protein I2F27_10130 [Acinetobacter sp. B5B]|nr:hypothetical protein [Acinetobacter baretiae]
MILLSSPMNTFFSSKYDVQLPSTLEIKILEGFHEHSSAIFFNFYKEKFEGFDYKTISARYGDLTGFEASVNKIHIDDYMNDQHYDEREIINIGFALVILVQKLWNRLRADECTIILSSNLNSEFGSNASLTFHKKRANEVLMMSSLDNCAQAVLICNNNDEFL